MGGYYPGQGFRQGSPYDELRGTRRHKGIDFPAEAGTTIPVAADGVVVGRGNHTDYGNMAIVKHVDPASTTDKYTLYAHMPDVDSTPELGTTVTKGQRIGVVGSTGRSTGPHLHFELLILQAGTWWNEDRHWEGGPTGITGTTGRVDPAEDTNWGQIDVYRGEALATSSTSSTASTGSLASEDLCFLDGNGMCPE
jgi:murein DD-endopeptidase MepM/ murein hydrolase activator NlpD